MNNKSTLKFGVAILTLICAFCAMNFALAKPSNVPLDADSAVIRTYFAPLGPNHQPSKTKQKNFQCSEQIFTVLELSEYPAGKHDLVVKWIDPSRNVREHTQYSFGVSDSGQTKLWAWLELAPAAGSSLIAWMNPAAGLEEFIGTWDVEVKINNRMVSKRQFEVIC